MQSVHTLRVMVDLHVELDSEGRVVRAALDSRTPLASFVEDEYPEHARKALNAQATKSRLAEGKVRVLAYRGHEVLYYDLVKVTKLHVVLRRNGRDSKWQRTWGRQVGTSGYWRPAIVQEDLDALNAKHQRET